MIQKIASCLTEYSIDHCWVDPAKAQWCKYALEKQIAMFFFTFICFLIATVTSTWLELTSFVLTFYLFRQRLGGYHAKTFLSCQVVSLGSVAIVIMIIGPILEHLNSIALFILDAIIISYTYFLKPAYPDSVHFSQTIYSANRMRKNRMLLVLVFLQLLSLTLCNFTFFIYSLLGLAITDLSVIFQIHLQHQKKGCR